MTGYLVSSTLGRDVWDVCQDQDKTVVFKEFKGLWGWVLNHRQSLLTNAPIDDPRSSGTPPGHIPIQRFISAPAMADGVLVGQVALVNSDRDYDERDLAQIERLADLYAMAIQRKRMEEHLRESQEQFNAFMDHLPAMAFIKDNQFRHIYLNKYLRERFDAADWIATHRRSPALRNAGPDHCRHPDPATAGRSYPATRRRNRVHHHFHGPASKDDTIGFGEK